MVNPVPLHPLRQWRLDKGKTLAWCAEQVGTSRQVWSDWERRRRKPSSEFMPKVRALTAGEITADDFYPPLSDAA